MSEEVERLGKWIATANERWHWSRRTIEERTGVGERTIRAIENGQRHELQDKTIDGICRGYNLDRATINRISRGEDVPVPNDPPNGTKLASTPPPAEFESSRIWAELDDLRRRMVEQDERMTLKLDRLAERIDAQGD